MLDERWMAPLTLLSPSPDRLRPMAESFRELPLPLFTASPGDEDEATPSAMTGRLPSYIADHRQRLRDRFLQAGGTALPDYEMLELVLFRAIPRQDVKPLARLLLDTFGDLTASSPPLPPGCNWSRVPVPPSCWS